MQPETGEKLKATEQTDSATANLKSTGTSEYEDLKNKLQADMVRLRNETFHLRHEIRRSSMIRNKPESIETKIEESYEAQRKRLENRALEKDIELKETTLTKLFSFLTWETVAVFTIAFLQGFNKMKLEEWNFRVLVTATIIQITVMLTIAVKHLFPEQE